MLRLVIQSSIELRIYMISWAPRKITIGVVQNRVILIPAGFLSLREDASQMVRLHPHHLRVSLYALNLLMLTWLLRHYFIFNVKKLPFNISWLLLCLLRLLNELWLGLVVLLAGCLLPQLRVGWGSVLGLQDFDIEKLLKLFAWLWDNCRYNYGFFR